MTLKHDSAIAHVTGQAVFINDMEASSETLYGYVLYSPFAHAEIVSTDISAALDFPGVFAVAGASDIPGKNQMGPVVHDEPCLASGYVKCIGQAVFLIAAKTKAIAVEAASLIRIEYRELPSVTTLEEAIFRDSRLCEPRVLSRGNVVTGLSSSKYQVKGEVRSGAQEHWYLETQTALALPGEGNEMTVYASSQHPSETQAIVSEVLGIDRHRVKVEVKRMGGAFGGKETQGNHVAAWAALLASKSGKPVKVHLSRDDDQIITGKRHRFMSRYTIGFSETGMIQAFEAELHGDAGCATDLSRAILDRALFHTDNAYYIPDFKVTGELWKTNLPSNTAFRGFGGPQGMAVIEQAVDHVARFLKKDPTEIRMLNFYREAPFQITPYRQIVEESPLKRLAEKLLKSSDYYERRQKIRLFNTENEFVKRGIAFSPVKFGISFTTSFLNQAAALVNIYQDGSVILHHGGTEMGQGLHTKIIAIASDLLGISPEHFRVAATDTNIIPNTSATAASSGSDLNGMAVKDAIDKLKQRISQSVCAGWGCPVCDLQFINEYICHPENPELRIAFVDAIRQAYLRQTALSASGYYRTPGLTYDPKTAQGKAFHYYVYSMAVSEVECDMLNGAVTVLRTDILHEGGHSLHPEIDRGQIVGGFMQGLGWVTTEVVQWDEKGYLLNHSPDTYKIPTIADIPEILNVEFTESLTPPETIYQSKAIGEPPFMLALSVWMAIRDSLADQMKESELGRIELPLTYEWIVKKFRYGIQK